MPTRPLVARLAAAAAAVTLGLAACAPAATESPAPAQPTTSTTSEPREPVDVTELEVPSQLQFEVMTVEGDVFDGTDILGTPTLLWFWAEWCPVCNAEAPLIADALDELPAGVQVYGVPGRSDQAGMERFIDDHDLDGIDHLIDPDGSIWSAFGVASQPALVVISADGTIQTIPGSVGKSGLLQAAESIA